MPSFLSLDLRTRIASGETVRSVAVRFCVCAATAVRLGQKARAGEDLSARPRGAPPEMIIRGAVADWVKSRLAEKPDLTVRTLAAELCERGTTVTHDTVWRFMRREGLTFKKTLVASEQDRPKVARFRDRWKAHQHRISADRLVFLDAAWIKTNMSRLRGWFARGTALVAKVPHGHWKTLTFIGALRQDKIVAPCVFDGPINANTFTAWVEQSLVPVLKPGDVVVLDNLGSHKDPHARRAIRAVGAHLLGGDRGSRGTVQTRTAPRLSAGPFVEVCDVVAGARNHRQRPPSVLDVNILLKPRTGARLHAARFKWST